MPVLTVAWSIRGDAAPGFSRWDARAEPRPPDCGWLLLPLALAGVRADAGRGTGLPRLPDAAARRPVPLAADLDAAAGAGLRGRCTTIRATNGDNTWAVIGAVTLFGLVAGRPDPAHGLARRGLGPAFRQQRARAADPRHRRRARRGWRCGSRPIRPPIRQCLARDLAAICLSILVVWADPDPGPAALIAIWPRARLFRSPRTGSQDRGDELDHQLRPPDDQLAVLAARGAREPVDQVPRMRDHAVPPRAEGQPERLHELRPPHGDRPARAVRGAVRRRRLRRGEGAASRSPIRCSSATRSAIPTG